MTTKTLGVAILLLAPAAGVYLAGLNDAAHYVGLGAVLGLQLCVLARPVAGFAVLLPMVYAAAAITAQSTDGVVALIVAIAAAVGAASSQGLHRGLIALLAAALLGSFESAAVGVVIERAGYLLAGGSYAFLLAVTVLRELHLQAQHLHPQSALGYSVLLAVLALVAWFAARLAELAHSWWLPLVVVAVSDPAEQGTARQGLVQSVLGATAAFVLVLLIDSLAASWVRGPILLGMLFLTMWAGVRRPRLFAVLLVPMLVLLATHAASYATPLNTLRASLPVFVPVIAISALGHWLFWTLRSSSGRLAV
jgi:hypothetical protein